MEEARELYRKVIRKFPKRRIVTKGIDDIWAADLLVMIQYSRQNRGYKYILNVIDTFSKYLFSVPLKTKTSLEVAKAFNKIIKTSKRCPNKLHVDRGKEFVNSQFKKMLEKNNIIMYHTFNEEKSAIVERVNRTLNEKLKPYFEVNKNHKWFNILQKIVQEYNEKDIHRSIGTVPAKVNKDNELEIKSKLFPLKTVAKREKKSDYKIGDLVRIPCWKYTFENKYNRKWTLEIFVISKICYTDPLTYVIKDLNDEIILGKFYKQELQKTNIIH